MILKSNFISSIIVFTLIISISNAETLHSLVKQGNEHYSREEWGDAIAKYLAAKSKDETPVVDFNLGNAYYKSGALERAAQAYLKALNDAPKEVKAQAFYNIGNTLLKSGKLEDAVKAYINSLKLNPSDIQSKQNLEYALRLMQQQQRQQEQDKNQQQQKQQQEQQDEQSQQQQQQQQAQSSQQNEQQKKQEQQHKSATKEQMSKQDALNILNALQNDEKTVQEKVIRKQLSDRKPKEKNW